MTDHTIPDSIVGVPAALRPFVDRWGYTHTPDQLRATAEAGIAALITLTGNDPDRPGLARTPARVVDALLEMTAAPGDPAELLSVVFDDAGPADQMVLLDPIPLESVCEHHLLPFTGSATVAYIPDGGRVVGLSKLGRLVDHYARQLQVQERLTQQVCDALTQHLQPIGAAVTIRATHTCMTVRGVRKAGGVMTTHALAGAFRDDPATRAEYMASHRQA